MFGVTFLLHIRARELRRSLWISPKEKGMPKWKEERIREPGVFYRKKKQEKKFFPKKNSVKKQEPTVFED